MLFISLKRRQRSQNDSAILESNLIHQTRRQEYHTQANRHITIYWEKIKAYHLVSAHYSLRNQLYALVTLISKCSKYAAVIAESDEEWNLMGYAAETIRMDSKSCLFLFKERKWVSKCSCNLSVSCSSNYVTSNTEVVLVIKSESIQSSSSKNVNKIDKREKIHCGCQFINFLF